MTAVPPFAAPESVEQAYWTWQAIVVWLALLGELLAVFFVYRVLVRGGSPASTLLWMVVILAAPWLGLGLYYLLPRRLQVRRLRRVRRSGARLREVRPAGAGDVDDGAGDAVADVPGGGLEALLASEAAGGVFGGNAVRWLASGEEWFDCAARAIAAATRHVHCIVFIFRPDTTGRRFLELLTAAAQRGVAVRLCYDSVGSFRLKARHLAELRRAGGRAEAFLPLLWRRRPLTLNLRNHRKLLVVDGEVGWVGGRNIADEYRTDRVGRRRPWFDAMVELRGPVVDRLQDVFVQDWCTATDEVLADAFRVRAPRAGDCRVAIVGSGPDREQPELWFAIVQALGEARRTIDLSSPYLVLPPTLAFALQLARARGVRVRIFTNGERAEAPILYHAQRHHYRRLLEHGIELYETTGSYNHAKYLVIDERTVFVGSANMDLRSAYLNFEIAAVALDAPALAAAVLATDSQRGADARRVTADGLPQSPFWRAVDGLCGLFSPLL